MSLHPNTVLLVVVAVILWLAARGRLAALVAALEGKKGGAPLRPSGSTEGPAGGGATNIHPGAHPFGLATVTYSHIAPGQYWQGANAPDRGLVPDETGEWNYGTPAGSRLPVFLPEHGRGWSEEKQEFIPGVGGVEVWKKGKAKLAFLHLSSLWDQTAGTGGVVGTTGWPTSAQYGAGVAGPSNAHLAVIYNKAAEHYLN